LAAVALAAVGLVLGTILSGAPSNAILGTVAVLLAAGAAIYRPPLGLAILVFVYPFDLTTYAGPVKLTTSAVLIGVLMLVLVGRQILANPPAIAHSPLDIPVLIFAAASVLSLAAQTGNLSGQLVGLLKAGGGFLIFFIATQVVRALADALLVVGSVIATGLIQAMGALLPFVTGNRSVSLDAPATGTLIDANLFAGYLVLVIPLLLALGVAFRQRWVTVPTTVVALAFTAAMAVTFSRSGWLGLVAGACVVFLLLGERRWRIASIVAGVAACVLLAGLSNPIAARLGPSATGPAQMLADRSQVWSAAVRITLDHPIVGVGVDNFQYFYPIYSGRDDELNHAHNLFLNTAAERGILGLLTFVIIVVVVFRRLSVLMARAARPFQRALVAGLVGSFAAYFVHSMFDVSYYDYKILLLFWLLVGVTASLATSASWSPVRAARGERRQDARGHGELGPAPQASIG
jgi:putative inorganic carbon (HCO3(-)) transporter